MSNTIRNVKLKYDGDGVNLITNDVDHYWTSKEFYLTVHMHGTKKPTVTLRKIVV